MDENKFRKNAFLMMSIGLLLFFMPMSAISAEQSKPPEWILDTIFLPVSLNNTGTEIPDLFRDKKGKILIYYRIPRIEHSKGSVLPLLIDFTTHKKADLSTFELFKKPKTDGIYEILDGLERMNDFDVLNIFDYKIERGDFSIDKNPPSKAGKCNSPLGGYLTFEKQGGGDSYVFLLSSNNKFRIKINYFCYGMNGKERIEVNTFGIFPLIWIIDKNKILLGSISNPFFIVIDTNKIELALKENKTLIFDHNGVKGYWVRKSLIDRCINKAEEELNNKGYDIHSKKPLKGNMSVNEYIDQEITKELNETN
jgi:hypothetical protein